jgi:hypothetical protein
MRISQQHIDTFMQQGFVIIEKFISEAERQAALAGFHRVYPSYDTWIAKGKPKTVYNQKSGGNLFPWSDRGLNYAVTHPDIIDAAERIIGTREIRLCDGDISVRYAGDESVTGFHIDYGNNTLGPYMPRDHSNISFILNLEEIKPGMAPTLIVPDGKSDSEGVEMIVPAGSVCIYSSISTRHTSTPFTAPTGYRANMWAIYSRKDRPWDGGRTFTYKGGAMYEGMSRFIADATPRQLEMIGFPPPGDPLWTAEFTTRMAERYPGFDPAKYMIATEAAVAH